MTINIKDIKPGDTVTVEVAATETRPSYLITGEVWEAPTSFPGVPLVGNLYMAGDLDFTITDHEPAPKPLPTEPGYYISDAMSAGEWAATVYSRNGSGVWFRVEGGGAWTVMRAEDLPTDLRRPIFPEQAEEREKALDATTIEIPWKGLL